METVYKASSYDFQLPKELIAQEPPRERGASRLMVLDRKRETLTVDSFAALPKYLEPSLFVVNNSQVIPARLLGKRATGGKAEFLLLTPLPLLEIHPSGDGNQCEAQGLLRPAKQLRPGARVWFAENFFLTVLAHQAFGQARVQLHWQGELAGLLERHGQMPLPPYIKRPATREDGIRYQTSYAKPEKAGSVAAPTAGLHFSPELRKRLSEAGHAWTELTLYVGYGTFSPVRVQDIRHHAMHAEYMEFSGESATAVVKAKQEGRPVVAVGTTVVRALEGIYRATGAIQAHSGFTDIFLYPGQKIQVVDQLITNFHLPGSTLLMLVAAFAGRERILAAYQEAAARGMRFFSYGDAMLIK